MLNQFLAESSSFVGVFDGLLKANAGEAGALNDYANSFVVEVCHND